jgi:glycosyltransferase involved in cell wall biosynthesis
VPERVIDGMTGFVAKTDEAFAQAAVRLLTDDALWLAQHRAALARQRSRSWDTVAADFERLMAS